MEPLLEVKDLSVHFKTPEGLVYAVNHVDFNLFKGETLAIVGESGCGKSVTTMSLLRLIPGASTNIHSGTAMFDDGECKKDLLKLSKEELRQVRGRQIGFIFQDPLNSLNPVLTIGTQISESLVEHCHLSAEQARKRGIEILKRVKIADAENRYDCYPHQLSGGMRQRVMIAIAIACEPKILIADEPTTALDVTIQAQIVELITSLQEEMNLSVIWITHDLGVVAGLADRVLVMYGGVVVELAQVDDLYERPCHPYTKGLLGAIPRPGMKDEKLVNIPGVPPDITITPNFCAFHPRCIYAMEQCSHQIPPHVALTDLHLCTCFSAEQFWREYER